METFIGSQRSSVVRQAELCSIVLVTCMMTALLTVESVGAADDFLDKLKSATEKLQQLQGQQPQTQSPQNTSPRRTPQPAPSQSTQEVAQTESGPLDFTSKPRFEGESGTPEATAKIAKSVGKYDVIGIKLGMPAKEAVAALQARGLQFKPETFKYATLPGPLTYGLYAMNQALLRQQGLPPNAEKIYLTLTMPPNEPVVAKISRFLMFSKETAPTQQGLAADLIKKYGPVTHDAGPGALNPGGVRDIFWIDDPQGNRLKTISQQDLGNCRSEPAFSSSKDEFNTIPSASYIEADSNRIRYLLEHGYTETGSTGINTSLCGDYTMVHARLFYAYPLGISSPDVVGGLSVTLATSRSTAAPSTPRTTTS